LSTYTADETKTAVVEKLLFFLKHVQPHPVPVVGETAERETKLENFPAVGHHQPFQSLNPDLGSKSGVIDLLSLQLRVASSDGERDVAIVCHD